MVSYPDRLESFGLSHYYQLGQVHLIAQIASFMKYFQKWANSRPLLYFRFSIQLTVNVQYKFRRWLVWIHRPLESKSTAQPTEPQPLPFWQICLQCFEIERNVDLDWSGIHFLLWIYYFHKINWRNYSNVRISQWLSTNV